MLLIGLSLVKLLAQLIDYVLWFITFKDRNKVISRLLLWCSVIRSVSTWYNYYFIILLVICFCIVNQSDIISLSVKTKSNIIHKDWLNFRGIKIFEQKRRDGT